MYKKKLEYSHITINFIYSLKGTRFLVVPFNKDDFKPNFFNAVQKINELIKNIELKDNINFDLLGYNGNKIGTYTNGIYKTYTTYRQKYLKYKQKYLKLKKLQL